MKTKEEIDWKKLDPRQNLTKAERAIRAMIQLHEDLLTIDPDAPSIIRGQSSEWNELLEVK